MTSNVAADIMAEVDRQKAQIAAERRVSAMAARLSPQHRYSKKALALMTLARPALIASLATMPKAKPE